jgi:hypothetical protein
MQKLLNALDRTFMMMPALLMDALKDFITSEPYEKKSRRCEESQRACCRDMNM